MATTAPAPDNSQLPDPAKLGADQRPETSREDDARDMSPVLAETDKNQSPDTTGQRIATPQGSEFDRQRRQGAAADGTPNSNPTPGQGMGRAGYNGDEDRTYDQNSRRGGLGSSGGRDEHPASDAPADPNPFAGGYDGGGSDQPSPDQTKHLGLNTPSPTE